MGRFIPSVAKHIGYVDADIAGAASAPDKPRRMQILGNSHLHR